MFFAHSLILKKQERIMTLIMIMGLSLLIYVLAERKVRMALQINNETFPNRKSKHTNRPILH